jgi:hypothetical protein
MQDSEKQQSRFRRGGIGPFFTSVALGKRHRLPRVLCLPIEKSFGTNASELRTQTEVTRYASIIRIGCNRRV